MPKKGVLWVLELPSNMKRKLKVFALLKEGAKGKKEGKKGQRPEASFNLYLSLRDKAQDGILELS